MIINMLIKEKEAIKGIHLIIFQEINIAIILDKKEVEAEAGVGIVEVGVEVGVGEVAVVEEIHLNVLIQIRFTNLMIILSD
jgi:hypothetical protein